MEYHESIKRKYRVLEYTSILAPKRKNGEWSRAQVANPGEGPLTSVSAKKKKVPCFKGGSHFINEYQREREKLKEGSRWGSGGAALSRNHLRNLSDIVSRLIFHADFKYKISW